MNLFKKDKELILKITNAVLLIWLITAMVFFANSVVDMFLTEPVRVTTYEKFETKCDKDQTKKDCRSWYEDELYYQKRENFDKTRTLYISFFNIIIVGSSMYFINKKNK